MNKIEQMNQILLHLLDELPETEAALLKAELTSLFSTLCRHLEAVSSTQALYDAVAGKIRAKASVQKRKLVSRLKEEVLL